jgi:regulator of protease activity HflC (stomatin/prohibitin superfamily)
MRLAIEKAITGNHIVLEAVLVRNVELPPMLQQAIVDKLTEEQNALRMKFVIDHEKEEAERKKIEAGGIAAFQDIVAAKITDSLLRWKQIEALAKLAQSPNAKVVMLGSGKDLPLMVESGK